MTYEWCVVVMKLPITSFAHSFGLLNHLNSFPRGMCRLNTKFDTDSLLYSFSHFECDGHTVTCSLSGIYHPHWLVQWNHHCSRMHIPVPSPWLPGYIDVTKTILIILTMVGFFPDRLHKYNRMDCFHLFGLLMTFPIAIWTFFQTLPSHRAVVFYPLNREKFTVRFAFYIGGVTSSVKAVLRNISYCLFSIHIPVHW